MNKKALIIGNWKMNVLPKEASSFVSTIKSSLSVDVYERCTVGIAPQHAMLSTLAELFEGTELQLASQNVHWADSGAHTGEISPLLLKYFNTRFAIIGHSERRQFYGETDESVSRRVVGALEHGLIPVICVGESEEEYRAQRSVEVTKLQLEAAISALGADKASQLVVAYEPVWAIGTGLAATPEHAKDLHTVIRDCLTRKFADSAKLIPILYGGSTKPDNIEELMLVDNVDGALVGGSSLNPEVFSDLITLGSKAYSSKS